MAVAEIATAEQVDLSRCGAVHSSWATSDRIGDDRESTASPSASAKYAVVVPGVDQQAVALAGKAAAAARPMAIFSAARPSPRSSSGTLERGLEVDGAAMHLAQPALLGHQRQVTAHGFARNVRGCRRDRRRCAAGLADQRGDALTAFFGLHDSKPSLPVRSVYDSRMTVRSNIVNISSCLQRDSYPSLRPRPETACDVAVIGAGVVGCAIARSFAIRGWKMMVVEKPSDILEGASKGNSALLHTGFDEPTGSDELASCSPGFHTYRRIHRRMNLPLVETGGAGCRLGRATAGEAPRHRCPSRPTTARRSGGHRPDELRRREPGLSESALGAVDAGRGDHRPVERAARLYQPGH